MNLAQTRYNLGLSSIVELTQAQLNLTQAQIAETSAKFDYETETSQPSVIGLEERISELLCISRRQGNMD